MPVAVSCAILIKYKNQRFVIYQDAKLRLSSMCRKCLTAIARSSLSYGLYLSARLIYCSEMLVIASLVWSVAVVLLRLPYLMQLLTVILPLRSHVFAFCANNVA